MASISFLLENELDHSLRRQIVFCDRLNPLDMYSDIEFITFYRMDRIMFTELLNKFENYMIQSTSRSHAIPAATQLATTLHFLASGTFQEVVASCHGFSQPSLSENIFASKSCWTKENSMWIPREIWLSKSIGVH